MRGEMAEKEGDREAEAGRWGGEKEAEEEAADL